VEGGIEEDDPRPTGSSISSLEIRDMSTAASDTTAAPGDLPRKALSPGRIAAACLIGTLVEIYDFILYAFVAATVLGPLFFPGAEPWLATLAALSTHAVAFFFRPLGAIAFGAIGDRLGRRGALMLSLTLMGLATVGVGLLPTYATIGVAGPILLVTLRVLQGLAMGGEWGGAVTVAVEHAPPSRKVLYGSMPQVGSVAGLGLAVSSLLVIEFLVDEATFLSWGWRIPFLASAVLIGLGLMVRRRLAETPEFVEAQDSAPRSTMRETVRGAGTAVGAIALAWLSVNVVVYALMTGLLAYVKTYGDGVDVVDVQIGMVICAVLLIVFTVGAAQLAQRIDRRRIVLISGVITVVWAFPGFLLVASGQQALLWLAMVIGVIPYGLANGTLPSLMSEYFPVRLRYTGVAVSFAISNVIGGALLPIPALALVERMDGSSVPLSVALTLGGLGTIGGAIALARLPRHSNVSDPR
jgi:MFS transporter, MHS family, shikimate and dehydroshikimate transport protein